MRGGCRLVILAGGLSRRMGRDKAALPAGDGTLIEHIARRLAPVVEETIVAGASGRHHLPGTTMVDDRYPGLGPLAGIHAGLLVARSPLVWVVGCDYPMSIRGWPPCCAGWPVRLTPWSRASTRSRRASAPSTIAGWHPASSASSRPASAASKCCWPPARSAM